jgi:transcriptional regulator with XRE-family HTH domain
MGKKVPESNDKQSPSWSALLRQAIESSGESRYAIAKRAGIGENILSRFMAGRGISLDTANKIGGAIGVELTAPKKRTKKV